MCLILIGWRAHPAYRLVVAANRDEHFSRPAAPAAFWDDYPEILAGRDLEAAGTWLGMSLHGRFAAVTNYRNPADRKIGAPTRGRLVSNFLAGKQSPRAYLARLADTAAQYNGFSMLAGTLESLYFFSNRGNGPIAIAPGVTGLSNHLLDTGWPKVEKGKARLHELLQAPFDPEAYFGFLSDTEPAPLASLPSTGVPAELEERLSAIRIPPFAGYGTRCSTVLCVAEDGHVDFQERSYAEDGSTSGTIRYRLKIAMPAWKARASSRRARSRPRGTSRPPA
jgi:uncharacterized protein with NRDE domain